MFKKKSLAYFRLFILVGILTILGGCNFLSDNKPKNDMGNATDNKKKKQETIDDYTDEYAITPNFEHQKYKDLLSQFKLQKHRFEIDTCNFKYNDQSFFIGDSIDKIKSIFGEPDGEIIPSLDGSVESYKYDELKLTFRFSLPQKKLINFWIFLSDYKGNYSNNRFEIILLRGVPYKLDMDLNDWMELSDLNHDKLRRRSRSFFMLQKECPPNDLERIFTSIGSEAAYESEGAGHLTYSGAFDPETSSPIQSLSVSLTDLEEFKK